MKDLLNTYKQQAIKKSDYFEPIVQTRKENKVSTRKEVKQSGMVGRYSLSM
jgi:hypothetical protein